MRRFIAVIAGIILFNALIVLLSIPFEAMYRNADFNKSIPGAVCLGLAALLTGIFIGWVARNIWLVRALVVYVVCGILFALEWSMFGQYLGFIWLAVRQSFILMLILVGAYIGNLLFEKRHSVK